MEITPEMIKAVKEHQAAEEKREKEEYDRRYRQRQQEWEDRLTAMALAAARKVVPDLTRAQFSELEDVFSGYLRELNDW